MSTAYYALFHLLVTAASQSLGRGSPSLARFHLAAWTVRRSAWRAAALAAQSVAALLALAIGNTGFEGALLCVVAGESPLVVGEKTGFVWVIAQTAAMVAVDLVSPYRSRATHLSAFAYAGFQAGRKR